MKNITLSIDEAVLEQARVYAAKHKTTVNRLVREHLQQLVQTDQRAEGAREALLRLIDESPGRLGPGWKWNREDAYEGRLFPRHKRPAVRRARKIG
jgi:plasmid stability protein